MSRDPRKSTTGPEKAQLVPKRHNWSRKDTTGPEKTQLVPVLTRTDHENLQVVEVFI